MSSAANPTWLASGNIQIASFVTPVLLKDFTVKQCGSAQDRPTGVSGQGPNAPPGVLGSTLFAATDKQQVVVHGAGEVCRLTVSASVVDWHNGDLLVSDSSGNGYGKGADHSGEWIGAIALSHAFSLQLGRVQVTPPIPFTGSSW
jgi:hypothetical protein